jgi:diguanylate cyclase (GGDEF)-like protein
MPHDLRDLALVPKDLLQAALDGMPAGLVVVDLQGIAQLANDTAIRLLGLPRPGGKTKIGRVLARCQALDRAGRQQLASAFQRASRSGQKDMRLSFTVGKEIGSLAVDIRSAERLGWIITLQDVTETHQAQDWLLEHVSSDPVTGLRNRQHFMLMLQDVLANREQGAGMTAVVLVQLQRLKAASDALGPHANDTLLYMAGDRLRALLSDADLLARCGGDEFAVALVRADSRDSIADRAAFLVDRLAAPFLIEDQEVVLGAKLGIAIAPEDGTQADTLLSHASLAVPAADDPGLRRIGYFEIEMTQRARRRREIEADLREALQRGEFVLYYQPQVDLHRGRVTGLEALIRWLHPVRGLVSPADFIPIAEETGLICDIGAWVLGEACREAVRWPEDVTVAVNASPLQFEAGDYAATVAETLQETGLPARRLEIEITESFLLRDTGQVLRTLADLHAQGVRLVVDDFGTGYASLSQLSRFRFDKIKIDRSFVSAPVETTENSAIVRSIAALASSLGIPSTAEGVETETQLEQIRADGCTSVQGYYLSRPVPAGTVAEVLARLNQSAKEAA